MTHRLLIALVAIGLLAAVPAAQPVLTGADVFPPEEFAARRARLVDRIGDAVAVLQGATDRPGEQPFRQNNQFFYLCGVAEPWAILAVDGRTKRSTLFLRPRDARREERMFGPGLSPGPEAERATGIEAVVARDEFAGFVRGLEAEGRTIYVPFRPEVLGEASSTDPAALWRAIRQDPWDGRMSREEAFLRQLKSVAPHADVKDLDPILDAFRFLKSPREIAVLREATRVAGLGIMEAMRDARPGMFEYELQADAEFVFKKYGAYGPSYFALIAAGRNTYYSHYHRNTARLQDGDLIQFDYAPDFKYYQSDLSRVFPANGRFSARQREFYTIYLRLYQALMTSIKVHVAPHEIMQAAATKMDAIVAAFPFSDPKIRAAALAFAGRCRHSTADSLGHAVGMEVHDVEAGRTPTLEPGQVFTIEPAMQIEDEHVGLRTEDMLLITPNGYENLSAFVPIEIADIERLMVRRGLSDAHDTLVRPGGDRR